MQKKSYNTRLWQCRCQAGQHCQKPYLDVALLEKDLGTSFHLLKHGLKPFVNMATQFCNPLTCTMGRNSIISDRARISAVQQPGSEFANESGKVTLRIGRPTGRRDPCCAVLNPEGRKDLNQMPSLHIYTADGLIIHRTDTYDMDDVMILMSNDHDHEVDVANSSPVADNIVSLTAYRQARKPWHERSRPDHFDDFLDDGGIRRCQLLASMRDSSVMPVLKDVLPWFLEYLVQYRYPFTRIVPQAGILQASTGSIDYLSIEDGLIFIYSGESIMVMDLSAVWNVWAVDYMQAGKSALALELYDDTGTCMAVLTGVHNAGNQTDIMWNRLVSSLPRLEY